MKIIEPGHEHEKKVTPPEETSIWLPLVHIVIGNIKTLLKGTFHGVTHKFFQEYLDEFSIVLIYVSGNTNSNLFLKQGKRFCAEFVE